MACLVKGIVESAVTIHLRGDASSKKEGDHSPQRPPRSLSVRRAPPCAPYLFSAPSACSAMKNILLPGGPDTTRPGREATGGVVSATRAGSGV